MTRRKYKGGERGSIEEDQSSSKRANMASKVNDPVEEETEEPSHPELKEMLVDIKGAFFWDYSGIGILGIDGIWVTGRFANESFR